MAGRGTEITLDPITGIIVLFVIVALPIAMLHGGLWLLSRLSGWQRLAQRFPGDSTRSVAVGYGRAQIGYFPYPSFVGVGYDETGIHLRVMPFIPWHAPIRIPRSAIIEVSRCAVNNRRGIFHSSTDVDVELRLDDYSPTVRVPSDVWHDE